MKVTLLDVTKKPVSVIEQAASTCYDSTPSSSGAIMNHCYKSGHQSVLEFAHFTFRIEGVSRAFLAQLTRHRLASYAVRSQRYCSEDGFEFVTPDTINNNPEALLAYNQFMENCQSVYEYLQSQKIPNEDARMVLPNACNTVITFSMNGRALINAMNERLCTRAQWEIRNAFRKMKSVVEAYNDECKQFAQYFQPKCKKNAEMPFCTEAQSCGISPRLTDVYEGFRAMEELTKQAEEQFVDSDVAVITITKDE